MRGRSVKRMVQERRSKYEGAKAHLAFFFQNSASAYGVLLKSVTLLST